MANEQELKARAEKVREYEAHTIGSEEFHRFCGFSNMIATDGMLFVAETCGAFWLLEAVASHQPEIGKKHGELSRFQVWKLERRCEQQLKSVDEPPVSAPSWWLEAWSDTPNHPNSICLARQEIGYSDFPEDLSGFEFYAEGPVILLKNER